jgi:Acetyltransferase (GNAT) domain
MQNTPCLALIDREQLFMRTNLYTDSQKGIWDDFVRESKNGTFLFLRDYMDYHRDRFQDHSYLIWDRDLLLAVLPANRIDNTLVSHGGLTYGGFVVSRDLRLTAMVEFFPRFLEELTSRGLKTFLYKTIPRIYHSSPSEEDRYCLFRNGATSYRTDVLTVIDYRDRLPYQDLRVRRINRAKKLGVAVRQSNDYPVFWEILTSNLQERYGLQPVHTCNEISLLASRFPAEIRLYGAFEGEAMQAGAVIYLTTNVCHVQYNAATLRGKELAAQDILMDYLVENHSHSARYFDFGVSTENEGRHLSAGLVDYKEGFGARTIVHDFFRLELAQ